MANNLTVTYKGNTIHTVSASGSATLKTGGTWCESDIDLSYTFDGGSSGETVECVIPKYSSVKADSTYGSSISGVGFCIPERAMGTDTNSVWGSVNTSTHWLKVIFDTAIAITKIKFATYWSYGSSKF